MIFNINIDFGGVLSKHDESHIFWKRASVDIN